MQNITQNGIWILIAVAILVFFFLRRGRHGHGGFEGGGFGRGGHGQGGFGDGDHGHHDSEDGERMLETRSVLPEAVIDPVSGNAVRTAGAITLVYQGKAYYFASKENRDRFEAAPQDFAAKAQGVAVGGSDSEERPHHRHHGC